MSMMAFGMIEVLALLLSGTGSPTHDLVSLIRAEDYFQARNVKLDAAEMVKLALRDPADGKAQVQQLLAIRWLGENADAVKKAEGAKAALEALAAGRKAQDRQGFAKVYAGQALARLAGEPLPAVAAPLGSLADALAWCPIDSQFCGAIELRPVRSALPAKGSEMLRELLAKTMRGNDREEFFQAAEALGNLRVDRSAVAFTVNERGNPEKIVFRITGAGDRQRVADFIAKVSPGTVVQQEKGPKGEPVTLLSTPQRPPAFALVGDGEFIIGGYEGRGGAHLDLVREVLDVRAQKRKGLLAGPLAGRLKELPRNARSAIAWDLPEPARKKMFGGAPLPIPARLVGYLAKGDPADATKAGMSIHVRAEMKDEAEAKQAVQAAEGLRQQGLKALNDLPPQVKVPPAVLKAAKDALGAVKIEAAGKTARADLGLADESILAELFKFLLGAGPGAAAPLPPPGAP